MENKLYLGDGVYVGRANTGEIVLETSNGYSTTNTIFLEAEVLENFLLYLQEQGVEGVEL